VPSAVWCQTSIKSAVLRAESGTNRLDADESLKLSLVDNIGINMRSNKYIIPSFYVHTFFILGILATTSIRLIIVFKHLNPALIRPAWYVGIIGYIVFFAYCYYVAAKRKSLIVRHDLLSKVGKIQGIDSDDKELLEYILMSIVKSKEYINYMFIFVSSIAAIVIDLILVNLHSN